MLMLIVFILLLNPVSSFAFTQLGPVDKPGFDFKTMGFYQDELCFFGPTNSSHHWGFIAGRVVAFNDITGDRQCLIRLDTLATASNWSHMTSPQMFNFGSRFYATNIVVRHVSIDADTKVRYGFLNSFAADPSRGAYFEKLFGDTNLFCVTHNGTSTRVDSGQAPPTTWATFRIEIYPSVIRYFINDVQVCSIGTTLPHGNGLSLNIQIQTNAAVSKTIEVDYFDIQWSQNR